MLSHEKVAASSSIMTGSLAASQLPKMSRDLSKQDAAKLYVSCEPNLPKVSTPREYAYGPRYYARADGESSDKHCLFDHDEFADRLRIKLTEAVLDKAVFERHYRNAHDELERSTLALEMHDSRFTDGSSMQTLVHRNRRMRLERAVEEARQVLRSVEMEATTQRIWFDVNEPYMPA